MPSVAELAQHEEVHPSYGADWKRLLHKRAAGAFGQARASTVYVVALMALYAKIGQLTLKKEFLSSALSKTGLLSINRWLTAGRSCRG